MTMFFRYTIVVLIVFSLTACNSINGTLPPAATVTVSSTAATSPTPVIVNWENRWLRGIPCRAPCFEGVTPGVTTSQEALALLEKNPLMQEVQDFSIVRQSAKSLGWKWFNYDRSKDPFPDEIYPKGGLITYSVKGSSQIVEQIIPKLPTVKLKDITQTYGEPSHIRASVEYNQHTGKYYPFTVFVYLEQGFSLKNAVVSDKAQLDLEMQVELIGFFTPGLDGFKLQIPVGDKTLVKWQGIKEWKYYCRKLNDNTNAVETCDSLPDEAKQQLGF